MVPFRRKEDQDQLPAKSAKIVQGILAQSCTHRDEGDRIEFQFNKCGHDGRILP